MTVEELTAQCGLRVLVEGGTPGRPVTGCYIGDLLSWAMSRAGADEAWITVMGNVNAVAVAVLADCACILLCDNAPLDEDARARAREQGVAVLQSDERAFTLAVAIAKLLGR